MKADDLRSIFTYHAPHGNQAQRYERLRAAGLQLATLINELCPESGEKMNAIRRVQEAVMYANAAIACNEKPLCQLCGRIIQPGERAEPIGNDTGDRAHRECIDRRAK